MIKLALLLRTPGQGEIGDALRARLAALGIHVTACGRASVSAQMAEADFTRLFGPPPPLQAGFGLLAAPPPELALPPQLADSISLITIAPRHSTMQPPT